ncbi:Ring finger domain-containing protein [Cladophialophora immunda]|nr:Ring finger domain-containing protein [Cladophialophora immunda]
MGIIAMVVIVLSVCFKTARPPAERYDGIQPRRQTQAPQMCEHRGISISTLQLLPLVKYHVGAFARLRRTNSTLKSGDAGDVEEQRLATQANKEATGNPSQARLQIIRPIQAYFRQESPRFFGRDSVGKAEQPECPICTQPFVTNDTIRILPCNHRYHQGCIDPWLLGCSATCPICRIDVRTFLQP